MHHHFIPVITLVSEMEGLFSGREVDLVNGLANCCGNAFVQGQLFEKFHYTEVQRIVNVELHSAHSEPTPDQMVELKAFIEVRSKLDGPIAAIVVVVVVDVLLLLL